MFAESNKRSFSKRAMNEVDADIVIVGGGLTGLTCAFKILSKSSGLDVLILEARDRVGGRILPQKWSETFYADLEQKHITDLVTMLNMKVSSGKKNGTAKDMLYTKNGPISNLSGLSGPEVYSFLQSLHEITENLERNIDSKDETMTRLAGVSAEQILCELVHFPPARSLCRAFITSICITRKLEDISAMWLLTVLSGAGGFLNRLRVTLGSSTRYFVEGGFLQIVDALVQRILLANGVITLTSFVDKIRYNDDTVYVYTRSNCIRCKMVIITINPSEQNFIEIESHLSSKQLNDRPTYVAEENVFFNIIYQQPFWSNDNNYTSYILSTAESNSNLQFMFDASHRNKNGAQLSMLAGFLEKPNLTSTKISLFECLGECFEHENVTEYLVYEEYARSTFPMSVMRPGHIFNAKYTSTFSNRIYWASSEYAKDWPGTLDGAVEAGKVAGYLVLARVRPQVLTAQEMIEIMPKKNVTVKSSFVFSAIAYIGFGINLGILISFLREAYFAPL